MRATADANLIALFLEMMSAERGAAANTIAAYERDLADFSAFLAGKSSSLTGAGQKDVEAYLSVLAARGLSASSSARRLSAIRQCLKFLAGDGLRKNDPARHVATPKARPALPTTLDVKEVATLLDLAEKEASSAKDGKNNGPLRLYVLVELLYATGMRVSELVGLPRQSALRDSVFLTIIGKGNKERIVPLNDRARDALKLWLTRIPPGKFLFPANSNSGHLDRQVFARDLKALGLRAGIGAERVAPHIIRHAFASHLLAGGADLRALQILLGHADISTTQIYTHVLDQRLRELMETHHPMNKRAG